MKFDFRYCGCDCIDFLPASYWEGWAEVSVWSGEEDGTLVLDRGGDGVISDGSEWLGNSLVLENV